MLIHLSYLTTVVQLSFPQYWGGTENPTVSFQPIETSDSHKLGISYPILSTSISFAPLPHNNHHVTTLPTLGMYTTAPKSQHTSPSSVKIKPLAFISIQPHSGNVILHERLFPSSRLTQVLNYIHFQVYKEEINPFPL
jgi:hypothetical protein